MARRKRGITASEMPPRKRVKYMKITGKGSIKDPIDLTLKPEEGIIGNFQLRSMAPKPAK